MKKTETKDAVQRHLKSLQEMLEWTRTHKKSKTRDAVVKLIKTEMEKFKNPNEHSLVLRLPKSRALKFLEWEKKSK